MLYCNGEAVSEGFGQHYSSMYSGSMVGSGACVFAVMGYIISNTSHKTSCVELNTTILATIIGEPKQAIESAIEKLCAPDPQSRTKTEDGRRLIKRGEFEYFVVNFKHYRGLIQRTQKAEYMAEYMAKKRESEKLTEANSELTTANRELTGANASASAYASASGNQDNGEMSKTRLGQVSDADDLPSPDYAEVNRLLAHVKSKFGLPERDINTERIRANICELLGRGYKSEQIEEVAAWAKTPHGLAGCPQSAQSATDPVKFGQWLTTLDCHFNKLELDRKKRNK